jgi:ZIP family zinc transporter
MYHCTLQGVSVSIPIYYATGKKWKGLLWAFLSGISEPFGELFSIVLTLF